MTFNLAKRTFFLYAKLLNFRVRARLFINKLQTVYVANLCLIETEWKILLETIRIVITFYYYSNSITGSPKMDNNLYNLCNTFHYFCQLFFRLKLQKTVPLSRKCRKLYNIFQYLCFLKLYPQKFGALWGDERNVNSKMNFVHNLFVSYFPTLFFHVNFCYFLKKLSVFLQYEFLHYSHFYFVIFLVRS